MKKYIEINEAIPYCQCVEYDENIKDKEYCGNCGKKRESWDSTR